MLPESTAKNTPTTKTSPKSTPQSSQADFYAAPDGIIVSKNDYIQDTGRMLPEGTKASLDNIDQVSNKVVSESLDATEEIGKKSAKHLTINLQLFAYKGATDPRKIAGIVSGGENLSNPIRAMRGSGGNIGVVPKEVADNLRGREFSNFDAFRKAFWEEYSKSSYASKFSKSNIKRMSNGLAPKVIPSQQYGKHTSYVLHHKNPIHNGGGVYDLDNIIISSPRMHQEILDKGFHFNK
ncbi:hypothetical protein [Oceanirhabdus sp. W0125-5]|uniref:hypothetical protein n=1 Tax=Oceanirhabdus sp. W0125-5 TaxID=2999116 RepID=UPI0022F3014E|nr:hypothetical protein [Oceanirhabdus sp. W0125-5]WBW96132.1 hypothetical protein OW730_20930 [Oceanirhabdus sp. W0125-5]